MKKVLLVLAFVAVYGVSMSNENVVTFDDAQVTVVAAMDDNNVVTPEGEKEKEKAKKSTKAEVKTKAKSEGCAGKSEAKSEGCAGKADAKKDCASACGGKK